MTRINTNVSALVGQNNLARANANLSESLTRLSTGLRINTGADDPAGLIASENLRSDITSINAAIGNTDRASQVIATADSALGQVSSLLNDIRGLVTESANAGALSDEQIAANQLQVDSSLEALNRIAQTTTFQGRRLLDGSLDFITTAGAGFSNLSDLQIDQANLGASGSVAVDISVSTAATLAQVDVTGVPAAGAATNATADLTIATAAAAATGGPLNIGLVQQDAVGQTVNYGTTTAAGLSVSAVNGGAADGATGALNGGIDVVITDATTVANGAGNVAYNAATNVITLDADLTSGNVTEDEIATAIQAFNGGADFTASAVGTATLAAADAGTLTDVSTGGRDASTEAITLTATNGAAGNISLTLAEGTGIGTTPTVTNTGTAYTITVDDSATTTIGAIVTALNTELTNDATGVTAAYGGAASYIGSADVVTGATATLTGGVDAGNDVITVTADATGTTANGVTVTLIEANGQGTTPTAAFNGVNIEVTVDDTAATSIAAINTAINNLTGYSSTLVSGGDGNYTGATETPPAAATLAGGGGATGGLANDVVFELAGLSGSEVLSFGSGTSIAQLVSGINLISDATGVSATANGTTLELTSTEYGSDAFVDIEVIEDDADLFGDDRDTGSDIVASVNGVSATGDGNNLSINTATLDLSVTLAADYTGAASFTISGGGALFQLGPDVVSNQQARLGIGSVNTARLGGVSGALFRLGTGESADLSTDANTAAQIVEEAIDQVTSLRGRLGAFQRTTLETNKNALNDTLTNLTEAESSIRDADFAAETAELTRSQILVQSGTRVLAIANQNPQNVLALLN